MRFIDSFDVLLLDMMNTFVFNGDRFRGHHDFFVTYTELGGRTLPQPELDRVIRDVYRVMAVCYKEEAYFDSFPQVAAHLASHGATAHLPGDELERLVDVFALHERGEISPAYIETLHALSKTHRLGLVSNIWAPRRRFVEKLHDAGVHDLFEILVFSADHGPIKPSPKLFQIALDHFRDVPKEKIAYIGDNHRCDVGGAAGVGLTAIWLNLHQEPLDQVHPKPGHVVADLHALL